MRANVSRYLETIWIFLTKKAPQEVVCNIYRLPVNSVETWAIFRNKCIDGYHDEWCAGARKMTSNCNVWGQSWDVCLCWFYSGLYLDFTHRQNLVQLHPICLSIVRLFCNQHKCLTVLQNTNSQYHSVRSKDWGQSDRVATFTIVLPVSESCDQILKLHWVPLKASKKRQWKLVLASGCSYTRTF